MTIKICAFAAILASSNFIFGAGEKNNYTVESRAGVAFIHVDGSPVRGRMFYGNVPGTRYIDIDANRRDVTLSFCADKNIIDGQVGMNFGAPIKDVWIYEILLVDKTANESRQLYDFSADPCDKNLTSNWTQKSLEPWRDIVEKSTNTPPNPAKYANPPYALKNESGVLHIQKEFVDMSVRANQGRIHDIERLNFCIGKLELKSGHKYDLKISLRADTKGRFDVVVSNPNPFEILARSASETFMSQEKFAAAAGVDFVTFGIPAFWKDGDSVYERLVDARFKPVIEANKNAKIVVRVGLEPPDWWLDSHADELMCNADGTPIERMHAKFPSPSSQTYRADAIAALKRLINYIEKNYPDNIAGYHPSGGNSSEWFYGGTYEKGLHGYDRATECAWKKWLQKKYKSAENLRAAWRCENVDFESVKVPSPQERLQNKSALLDPEKCANVIDFNVFLQDEMSDTVLLAAQTIRSTAPKKRLSVMFYGYGINFSNVPNGPAYSGHYAFRKLLNSPDIDIFTAPINYKDRFLGGAKLSMSPAESAALAGKLWLDEDDNRTYLAPLSGSPPYVLDATQTGREETIKVLQRNMAQQAVKNNASWLMDLFGCGWFLDEVLWRQFDVFKRVETDMINSPSPYRPEVALSYDELSMCHIAGLPSAAFTCAQSVGKTPDSLSRTGVSFGQYLLDDILEKRAQPKLNFFAGAYALTQEQRAQMREVSKNSACVFVWNVGYVDLSSGKFSLDSVKDASGFEVEFAGDVEAFAYVSEEGKKAGLSNFGLHCKVSPIFSPIAQKDDVVLATYSNGKPAVLLRESGKYPQIFCGTTLLSIELCDFITRRAGVHKYADNEAVACANGDYVCVNTTKEGVHTIDLKEESEVFDALENKSLGTFKTMKIDMKKGDVKLLKIIRK